MLARDPQRNPPLWFERGLIVVTATILAWGGGGLLLADTGVFTAWRAGGFGIAGIALGCLVATRYRREVPAESDSRSSRWAALPAVGMVLVAAGNAIWNASYAGQHIAVGRDAGTYTTTAKWIATHGNLVVPAGLHSAGTAAALGPAPGGTWDAAGNTLQFQFAHLLPTMLAEAERLGGEALMFRFSAIIGALALCFVYAAGCRLVHRPWLVLAAVTGLGVSLPQIVVMRDSYSEPLSQLLLWSGIWLLLLALSRATTRGTLGLAALGGAALGGTCMAHIDAPAYLIIVPPLAAVAWLMHPAEDRGRLLRLYAAVAAGAAPPIVLGTLDVQLRSAGYYHMLHHSVMSLYLACLAMTVLSVVLVLVWPHATTLSRVSAVRRWLVAHRNRIGTLSGALVGGVLLLGWLVRPHVQHPHTQLGIYNQSFAEALPILQQQAGLAVDNTRTYAEQSLVWFSWYLGPVILVAAIIGFVIVVRRLVHLPSAAAALILLVPGSLTAIYLWNPSISADQIWASRRFVPASLPLFAIVAAAGFAAIAELLGRQIRRPAATQSILALSAVALVLFPLSTSWPVRHEKPQAGYLDVLERVCSTVGPDAAVVYAYGGPSEQLVMGTWGWCDVPANYLQEQITPAALSELAAQWRGRGRTLWILGGSPQDVTASSGVADPKLIASVPNDQELEHTLIRPPSRYVPLPLTIYGVPID